jgi:peptide/nickel transport system substrate-binding protein
MSRTPVRRRMVGAVAAAAVISLTAACSGAPAPDTSPSAPTSNFTIDTPAPTKDAGDVTWAMYREAASLDPIVAYDYPENTALSPMCESLLRQRNDMSYGDGLGKLTVVSPTQYDFAVAANATFWDGTPVTAEDVVFSLKRAADPAGGGYWASVFDRVKSIDAVGTDKVSITLTQPDYWLLGELSSTPGIIVQKKYAEAKGKDFGTVTGGVMCSGPLKLSSWESGKGLTMVPNPTYWDSSLPKPKLTSLTLMAAPDEASLTAGLKTGTIDGSYVVTLSTLSQLENDPDVKVYQGPPYLVPAMIVNATTGPLADPKVRQAVSLALDRKGIINTVFRGAGSLPRALEGSGTWGTARETFQTGYDALPEMSQDVTKAKELAKPLGIEGKTVRIGTSSALAPLNTSALAFKAACEAIGLKVEMVSVSPANYISFFIDPKARETVDAFGTNNYGNYADPSALYKSMGMIGAPQNYSQWNNQEATDALNAARGEADETKRAQDVIKAQQIITEELPWIPMASANNVLIMHKGVTGAPATFVYMFGPWAAYLGGA